MNFLRGLIVLKSYKNLLIWELLSGSSLCFDFLSIVAACQGKPDNSTISVQPIRQLIGPKHNIKSLGSCKVDLTMRFHNFRTDKLRN